MEKRNEGTEREHALRRLERIEDQVYRASDAFHAGDYETLKAIARDIQLQAKVLQTNADRIKEAIEPERCACCQEELVDGYRMGKLCSECYIYKSQADNTRR